jgi:hypothetical protein
VTQFFFDPSGTRNRVLTNGLLAWHSPRTFMTLDTPSPLPDGSWVVFPSFANSARRDLYMVKVPPQPAFDSDPASNGQPANVTITVNTPDDANIRNIRVQFGATPDLGSSSDVQPCGASAQCTLTIRVRPLELLYTKPVYLDDSNNKVGEGPMSVQIGNGGSGPG